LINKLRTKITNIFRRYCQGSRIHRTVVIWGGTKIREGVVIAEQTSIGRNVYIGPGVTIGSKCKIQNCAQIYEPAKIGNGVFIGPGAVLTNDKHPRAIFDNKVKKKFNKQRVIVNDGATIGAGAICVAPLKIGKYSIVAAGSVVIKDVKDFEIVQGVPAIHAGYCNENGIPISKQLGKRN
jgi:acetyltransferase-like isoleucine patch superfamily enzyme